jgi:hypothetical protein
MPIFAIEEATTEVSRERRGGKDSEIRTLEVHGNGGRNRARLMFGDCQQRPTVGYLTREWGQRIQPRWSQRQSPA